MDLGPMELGLILLAILLLFGYKKLPDASRSLGRSLRIFKGEMKGLKEDDGREAARDDAARTAVAGELVVPAHAPGRERLEAEEPAVSSIGRSTRSAQL